MKPTSGATRALRVVEHSVVEPAVPPGPLRTALTALQSHVGGDMMLHAVPAAAASLGFDRVAVVHLGGPGSPNVDIVDTVPAARRVSLNSRHLLAVLLNAASVVEAELDIVVDHRRCRAVAALMGSEVVRGYVVTPIRVSGEVVALLYGDLARSRRVPSAAHADALATFALGAGHLLTVERLRSSLARMTASTAPGASAATRRQELSSCPGGALTDREADVVGLMAIGRTNAQIGRELEISEGTVKSHAKSVFRKLDAANRAEAVAHFLALDERTRATASLQAVRLAHVDRLRTSWT